MKIFIKTACFALLFVLIQGIIPALLSADNTPVLAPAPTMTSSGSSALVDNKQVNSVAKALQWWADNSLFNWMKRLVTMAAITIKNAFEGLVDKVFAMLCTSLVKLWNFTSADSDTGVGYKTAKYVNDTAMPILYTIAGCFLYLFVVLKIFTGLFMNESPQKMMMYFAVVIFFVISYGLFYNIVITLFSHILSLMTINDIKMTTSELARNFAATLTGKEEIISKIAQPKITFDEIDTIYAQEGGAQALWMGIITQLLVSCMFIYFILQLLLLKGQQLVQLILSYFLGILILPITILSGFDLFVRWIKSFVGTVLYSFTWALLLMILYGISLMELGGLSSDNPVLATLPSILKLMAYFGTFALMTQVGKVGEMFTGGDSFGKIAQASSREFGSVIRTAGMAVAMPAMAAAGGSLFMGGMTHGLAVGKDAKMPGIGGSSGGSGSGGGSDSAKGGGGGGFRIPGQLGRSISSVTDFAKGAYGAGMATGQFGNKTGTSTVELAGKTLAAMRNSQSSKNDGSTSPLDGGFGGGFNNGGFN